MSRVIWFLYLASSIAFVVACGDDAAGDVDAADGPVACDCPAAESPLAGRIVRFRIDNPLSPGSAGGSAAFCPAGGVALGGACETQLLDANLALMSSSFTPGAEGYRCDWETVGVAMPQIGTAEVVCLLPAP